MYKFWKRFFDILISGLAMIILSPVYLILAIVVRVNLGGPVIFKQYRIGKGGKIFAFYKFRSMTNAKDENGILLPDAQRHTKFGRLLRATSLDELPQLWNIFKGDMALIGPRPKVAKDYLLFHKYYKGTDVRPGITGYSQAYGRNGVSWTKRLNHDNYYVDNVSFGLDVKIIFKTIATVLSKSDINKEKYFYYADELLDKGLITKNEYDAVMLKARELEARCGMGEKLNIKDFALNNEKDMPVVAEVEAYKKDEKSA